MVVDNDKLKPLALDPNPYLRVVHALQACELLFRPILCTKLNAPLGNVEGFIEPKFSSVKIMAKN